MPIGDPWILSQQNRIGFVMIDSNGDELAGLTCSGNISKNGAAAGAMAGAFAEISGMTGHYTYLATAGEADTVGIVNLEITAAGAVQQNLEYPVMQRTPSAVPFDPAATGNGYRVVTAGGVPIEGVDVMIRSVNDVTAPVVASGVTNATGYIRDSYGNIPLVDPGIYYVWRQKSEYSFDNPDTEVQS